MPGKECGVMDEKLRFVARLLEGETMASLCREFSISRKTGYKIWSRYQAGGSERSQPKTLQTGQPAAFSNRKVDRAAQTRKTVVGRTKDQGALSAQISRSSIASKEHRACGA